MNAGQSSQKINDTELKTVVYSPGTHLTNPLAVGVDVITSIWRNRELAWTLFVSDLKAQYRQSYLGYAWIFAPIIATTAIWLYLSQASVIDIKTPGIPYSLYVLSGSLVWTVFAASVQQPLTSFKEGKPVFMKLNVPVEAFIVAGFGHILFNLIIQITILIPAFLILHHTPAPTFWLFPLGNLCMMITGMCIGMTLVPLSSLYSDVGRSLTLALGFLMLLTPVVYPPPTSGLASVVMQWNPLAPIVMASRDFLLTGNLTYVPSMVMITAVCVVLLTLSFVALRIAMPRLVERMGM